MPPEKHLSRKAKNQAEKESRGGGGGTGSKRPRIAAEDDDSENDEIMDEPQDTQPKASVSGYKAQVKKNRRSKVIPYGLSPELRRLYDLSENLPLASIRPRKKKGFYEVEGVVRMKGDRYPRIPGAGKDRVYKSGRRALHEIRAMQKFAGRLIPELTFTR